MDRLLKIRLYDFALRYLSEINKSPNPLHYWNEAEKIIANNNSSEEELLAASLLSALSSFEIEKPNPLLNQLNHAHGDKNDITEESQIQSIYSAVECLNEVTGESVSIVSKCELENVTPELSDDEAVTIKEAAKQLNCTVEDLLIQASKEELLLYVSLSPFKAVLISPPSHPTPHVGSRKMNDYIVVPLLTRYARGLRYNHSIEINLYEPLHEPYDGHYWRLETPQEITINNVFVQLDVIGQINIPKAKTSLPIQKKSELAHTTELQLGFEKIKGKQSKSSKPQKVNEKFIPFKNLRSNEISFVMMSDRSAKLVIRGKNVEIFPDDFRMKGDSYGWKLLESACVCGGSLSKGLERINKSCNLELKKNSITTKISRVRTKLIGAMGLVDGDNPIPYTKGDGYRFNFKVMQDKNLHSEYVTKGADAMDYAENISPDEREGDDALPYS